jgi:triosephosphate isomerase
MHGTIAESLKLALGVKNAVAGIGERVEVLVCPPFGVLHAVGEALKGSRVMLGAQNCHWEDSGAFTGEVSPPMLADLGCTYVIVGHSERRAYFGETDEVVSRKTLALLKHRLNPIVCVGEHLEDREKGSTKDVIRGQVLGSLDGIDEEKMLHTVIAYEPVWAIGTGKTATPDQAQEVHAFIRNILIDLHGLEVALKVRILYGGSVKPDNVSSLMARQDIDGGLVGGASLKAGSFSEIVAYDSGGN